MDERAMAARTRDLEQAYIARVFRTHAQQIRDLRREIEELGERNGGESDADTAGQLSARLQLIQDEKRELELETQRDKGELKRMKGDLERLEEENASLKKAQEGGGGRSTSPDAISSLASTQNEIYRLVREFTEISGDYRARVSRLEEDVQRHVKAEARLEGELQKLRGGGLDTSVLRKRISELEAEVESFGDKRRQLESDGAVIKQQRDTIVLLQDSVASKDKVIDRLTGQIDRLKRDGACGETIVPQRPVADPFVAQPSGAQPKKGKGVLASKLRDAPDAGKKGEKLVNVGSLIRDDNKSFFNNLSFTNSSPAADRRGKRK